MTIRRLKELRRIKHFRMRAAKALRRHRRVGRRRKVDPLEFIQPKVIRRGLARTYIPKAIRLKFPPDFDLIDHIDSSLDFFHLLRDRILTNPVKKIEIDHTSIKNLSPEAGLVLIAELYRADKYAPRCRKLGRHPTDEKVSDIFQKIGYWEHFGVRYTGPQKEDREFIIHKTGRRVSGQVVKEVVTHISDVACFTSTEQKRLYEAFVECMDNVMNHAYPDPHVEPPVLVGQWWMLAYKDKSTGEVWLCFYDQGAGIPGTIRTRFNEMIPILRSSDSDIIVKAVTHGSYSKHDLNTRGNGLPLLKVFVDEAVDGELIIISKLGFCRFKHGQEPTTMPLLRGLDGTLIIWRLKR